MNFFTLSVFCIAIFAKAQSNFTFFTVGTVLFSQADLNRDCWPPEHAALLTSRMLLRNLMPKVDSLKPEDDSFVTDIIEYFRLLLEVIRSTTTGRTKHILLLALTDTMGGYMKHLILPISKYAYYAGNVDYSSIIKLFQLYDELKNFLRTNGNGWAKPWKRAGKNVKAKALSLQSPSPATDPCKGLIYYRSSKSNNKDDQSAPAAPKGCRMEVPMPFFDSKSHPSAIAVPFKTFGLRNLESRVSAYIMVKFYVAVSKCMASRNTADEDVQFFNNNVFSFIVNKIMSHLCDEKFYAAFGGVLRILETIKQNEGKKGNSIGNFNLIPEVEDKEPYPFLGEGEGDDIIGNNKGGKQSKLSKESRSKNNLILFAALATIIIWFCLGAAFICCRIRASKNKKDDKIKALALIGDDDKPPSKPSSTSEESDLIEACRIGTCPAYKNAPASSNSTIPEAYGQVVPAKNSRNTPKSSSQSTDSEGNSRPLTDNTNKRRAITDKDNQLGPPKLQIQNLQFYPPSFACHTSMTGKIKLDSSTDEYTSRDDAKHPYVFGYDIETSSEETSPRGGTTDGENEIGGNMSK